MFQTLLPGEGWQLVSEGHRNTDGPAVNEKGELFFSEPGNNRIHKVGLDGKTTVFAENTSGANGMMFGPDGRLYAGATRSRQIVAYDAAGKTELVAEDVLVNDLAVNVKGDLYFTDSPGKKVWFVPKGGKPRIVDEGIEYPNGVMFSPDQTLLYVSDYAAQLSWAFQIQPDGSLAHKQRYFYVHMPDAATKSGADGMTADTNGSVYIATSLGVQVFDQIGKCHAIIPAPQRGPLVEREVRRGESRRDVRDQRRQGLQAEGEDERRRLLARADQAAAPPQLTRGDPGRADARARHTRNRRCDSRDQRRAPEPPRPGSPSMRRSWSSTADVSCTVSRGIQTAGPAFVLRSSRPRPEIPVRALERCACRPASRHEDHFRPDARTSASPGAKTCLYTSVRCSTRPVLSPMVSSCTPIRSSSVR